MCAWRDEYIGALAEMDRDTVVFSHFVGINAAIAVATGRPELTVRHLDHVSVTTFEIERGDLRLVEVGGAGATEVL